MKKPFRVMVNTERCAACFAPMREIWMLVYRPIIGWEALCSDCALILMRRAGQKVPVQSTLDDLLPSDN